ncbi:unnamed protein product [Rotaria sp. Silwood1]|nr:unnamed protein product [Rotaria sp. Silwood1]
MSMAKEDLAKDNEKRSCELATDFTHLQLQPKHKIMTLKFALNQAFVRGKNPIDEHPLNYDEYNPFNICAASNVPHLSSNDRFYEFSIDEVLVGKLNISSQIIFIRLLMHRCKWLRRSTIIYEISDLSNNANYSIRHVETDLLQDNDLDASIYLLNNDQICDFCKTK